MRLIKRKIQEFLSLPRGTENQEYVVHCWVCLATEVSIEHFGEKVFQKDRIVDFLN